MTDRVILGISDSHPSGAALIKNGKLLSCINEERMSRIKNDCGFPILAIKQMLMDNSIEPHEVNLVAFTSYSITPIDLNELAKRTRDTRLAVIMFSNIARFMPTAITENVGCPLTSVGRKLYRRVFFLPRYKKILSDIGITAPIVGYDHHMTHAVTSYFFTGQPKKKMLIFTCDGEGDGLCASVNIGERGRIEKVVSIPFIHSIAKMYNEVTWYLGLKPWDNEYKVMGMAPYSNEHDARKSVAVFNRTAGIDNRDPRKFRNYINHWAHAYGQYLRKNLYKHRFDSIAFSIQNLFENIVTEWVSNNIDYYGIHDIMLSGGGFLNVKANQKILEMENVSSLFVAPSCGDESAPIGAAMMGYIELCNQDGVRADFTPVNEIYLGPNFDNKIDDYVRTIDRQKYKIEHHKDVEGSVAELLAKGNIVARFSGRMEFGARALGNRSILADPRRLSLVREINAQIKHRDFWMPFAPSMIRESAKQIINMPIKEYNDQYMIISFNTTEFGKRNIIAAIHQADKTCRPQVVDKSWNKKYHHLIKEFKNETGVGCVLNTSFNIHGEPIVCSPQDAMSTMERSGLKVLALGDYIIKKI